MLGQITLPPSQVRRAMASDRLHLFQFFDLASITSYYTFHLTASFWAVDRNGPNIPVRLSCSVCGWLARRGPLGDRFGRKRVIWGSILGVLPFTLALPYVGLTATLMLSIIIGLVLSSAFSAIVVYGQELMPGRVGMVSGLFFGLAFGLGGIGAAVLGELADWTSIELVYRVRSSSLLIGILTLFLPYLEEEQTNFDGIDNRQGCQRNNLALLVLQRR